MKRIYFLFTIIVTLFIFSCSSNNEQNYEVEKYKQLYNETLDKYNAKCDDYDQLKRKYDNLSNSYSETDDINDDFVNGYNELLHRYNSICNDYNDLCNQYSALNIKFKRYSKILTNSEKKAENLLLEFDKHYDTFNDETARSIYDRIFKIKEDLEWGIYL